MSPPAGDAWYRSHLIDAGNEDYWLWRGNKLPVLKPFDWLPIELALDEADPDVDLLEHVILEDTKQTIHSLLAELTNRHRLVLEYRYGIGDRDPETLTQIGCRLGVTRERAGQLQCGAENQICDLLHIRRIHPPRK